MRWRWNSTLICIRRKTSVVAKPLRRQGLVKTGIPGEDYEMSKPKVYLETSFIGYLTSRLSGDLITAAHQKLTRAWWDEQRHKFELYVSGAWSKRSARVITEGCVRCVARCGGCRVRYELSFDLELQS